MGRVGIVGRLSDHRALVIDGRGLEHGRVTVIVTGLSGAPLTAQVARIPDLLHEPIVPALAAVPAAATPPNASMQVTATPTPRRRKLLTAHVPFC
jgi:hypothetical protein